MLYREITLDRIERNDGQPRTIFDEAKLEELRASIEEFGVRTPIEVRAIGAGKNIRYILVAGERRVRAARMAGLAKIPAMVTRDVADDVAFERAVAENVNRDDMKPLEEAAAFARLVAEFGRAVDEVARKFGKSPSYVQWRIDLLGLVDEAQELVNKGQMHTGIAWYVCRLSPDRQRVFLKKWANGEFPTFREAEAFAQACREAEANPQGSFFAAEEETDEQREERVAARRKLTSKIERLAAAGQILADIAAIDPVEVVRLLGSADGGVPAYLQQIKALRGQASKAVSVLTKAAAIVETITVELAPDLLAQADETVPADAGNDAVAVVDAGQVELAPVEAIPAGTEPEASAVEPVDVVPAVEVGVPSGVDASA